MDDSIRDLVIRCELDVEWTALSPGMAIWPDREQVSRFDGPLSTLETLQ
ncbi:MAG: hypothetical protein O7G85_08805 [Planctomycetota bacterium]|nr:hypothetical protein [Planctomycetota bacterium]